MSGGDSIPIIPCTPFSDAVPQVAEKPDVGDWDKRPKSSEQVVLSEEQQWAARAAAAARAADLLQDSFNSVSNVVATNYFGDGCSEGTALFDSLGKSLTEDSGWKKTLKDQISTLNAIAANCRTAGGLIADIDEVIARKMPK